MKPFSTLVTVQPWWVQVALNALNWPADGCVTTNSAEALMTPPPTGTSAFFTGVPLGAAPPDDPDELPDPDAVDALDDDVGVDAAPPVAGVQDWVLDTGNRGEAFAWRYHLVQAGLDPDQAEIGAWST